VRVFGRVRGTLLGLRAVAALAATWWLLGHTAPSDAGPADWSAVASVPSTACARCHPDHYASWHQSYHRTMTREATPEYVKGDFNDVVYEHLGLKTRMTRQGDAFYMETVDPGWALARAKAGANAEQLPPPRHVTLSVDRLVGSHWIQ